MSNNPHGLNERIRQRLNEEKAKRKLSTRDIAGLIGWSQARVAQKLTGRTPITMDELEGLCFALSLSPTEAIRDRGMEFSAEMTPTELRALEYLRSLPAPDRDAFFLLLRANAKANAGPERYALQPKDRLKKMSHR